MQSSSSAKNLKVLANTRQSTVDKTKRVGVEQSQKTSSADDFLEPSEFVSKITLDGADVMLVNTETIKHISVTSPSDRGSIFYKLIDITKKVESFVY